MLEKSPFAALCMLFALTLSATTGAHAQKVQPITPDMAVPPPPSFKLSPPKEQSQSLGTEQESIEIPIDAKQPVMPKEPNNKRLAQPSAQSTALPTTKSVPVGPVAPTAVQWGPLYQFPAANTFYLQPTKKPKVW